MKDKTKDPPKWIQDIIDQTGWTLAKVLRLIEREGRIK
jgi:hypothetical protein